MRVLGTNLLLNLLKFNKILKIQINLRKLKYNNELENSLYNKHQTFLKESAFIEEYEGGTLISETGLVKFVKLYPNLISKFQILHLIINGRVERPT